MAEPHVVLNAMTADDARVALTRCCGSARWVDAMLARRPWASAAALNDDAAAIWAGLNREDFLQAFAQHPRIGAGGSALTELGFAQRSRRGRLKEPSQGSCLIDKWSRQEQAAAGDADGDTQRALRAANDRYVDRFGYIFIVCATGKSAAEMLRLLEARLDNDPRRELAIAAGEQARITRLRLEKLGASWAR